MTTTAAETPMGNVTITLPAEYAAQIVADLKALRTSHPDLSTPAMHVVKVRLEVALSDAVPTPDFVAVDAARRVADARIGGALTGDVVDPCETQDAPTSPVIVTRVDDLDPEARYALWVCGLEGAHGRGVKCSGHFMRATGSGVEMAAVMGLYAHSYAERID